MFKKNLMFTSTTEWLIGKDQYTDYCMMVIWLWGALFLWENFPFPAGKYMQNSECILSQGILVQHNCHSVCLSFQ